MSCMLPSHANCRRRLTRAAALTWRLNSESSKRLAAACPVPSAQTALRHLLHRSESGRRLPSSVSSERERETAGARRQECGLPVTGLRRGHPHCLPSLADRRHALRRPPPPPRAARKPTIPAEILREGSEYARASVFGMCSGRSSVSTRSQASLCCSLTRDNPETHTLSQHRHDTTRHTLLRSAQHGQLHASSTIMATWVATSLPPQMVSPYAARIL